MSDAGFFKVYILLFG